MPFRAVDYFCVDSLPGEEELMVRLMRHLLNLEIIKTYEGTDHIQALIIGERVTGVAAYR